MSEAALLRIDKSTQKKIKQLASLTGRSMQSIASSAIEAYRRQFFFDELNSSVMALKKDPQKWQQELEERKAWDTTLLDGLETESWEKVISKPTKIKKKNV